MQNSLETTFAIHPIIRQRWSPRALTAEPISDEALGSLLEAARWAPSCYNEQPWRFLVAKRTDAPAFERLAGCLVEGNAWARQAAVLIMTVAKTSFDMNGAPNAHAWHDVGLAAENLTLQAEALGLSAHQMAGFDAAHAREALGIPEGFEPVTMIAVGHRGPAEGLPDKLAEMETAPRKRKPLEELAFGSRWDERPDWLAE